MSHRALQRLRQEFQPETLSPLGDEDEDEEDQHEPEKTNVFGAAMFDDDSSESSDDDDSEEDSVHENQNDVGKEHTNINEEQIDVDVENLDDLIKEYKIQDETQEENIATVDSKPSLFHYDIIVSGMEVRDLDINFVMRTALLGGSSETSGPGSGSGSGSSSRRRQNTLFGPPRGDWPRPPHYVGGGIGMRSCEEISSTSSSSSVQVLPWPYCDMKEKDSRCPSIQNWFEYIYSDSYQRDYRDLETVIASGDPNYLALFVAHHPFVVEALLQLSIVMYQMNQSQEGLSLLKRALWVFECSSLNSFLNVKKRIAFMDYQKHGNKQFFAALFRLVRVSCVAGLTRTSLSVSQFILSLDPLRDPMNVLLGIDHFALMCNTELCNTWLVDFVESERVYVTYQEEENQDSFECQLLDLPNFAFSYAFTLFRLHETTPSDDNIKEKADIAIKSAISRFPSVIGQLLGKNEVDLTSRSLQTDWPAVLGFIDDLTCQFQSRLSEAIKDPVIRACTSQAYNTVVKIFVKQNFKLWSSFSVMKWMHNQIVVLKEEKIDKVLKVASLSPAIRRFVKSDPIDYENRFQTMPVDANPLDPNIVALALNIDQNRRRLIQRNPRDAGANGDLLDDVGFAHAARNQYFGGPPTEEIDPDLPLAELFWRSALPWAEVRNPEQD